MDKRTYNLYCERVEALFEVAIQAHAEFDYWMRWSWVSLWVTGAFVVLIGIGHILDWHWTIRNVINGLSIISCAAMLALGLPRRAALSRAGKAIKEAEALINWMDRQLAAQQCTLLDRRDKQVLN